jgi:CRP-like cAMP-binding protein
LFQSGTSTLSASETSHFIHTLKGIFSSNELFRDRTDEDYIKLIGFFKEEFAKCGCHITTPGKKGNKMFIIKEGTVDVIIDEIKVNTLERGAVIGELSLLHGAPRSALCQVSSAEGAVLYSLSRERFLEFVDKSFDARDRELSRRLANVPELGAFVERAKLVKCMTPRRYALGDKLYKQSYPANQVIVVDSGFAAVFTRGDH